VNDFLSVSHKSSLWPEPGDSHAQRSAQPCPSAIRNDPHRKKKAPHSPYKSVKATSPFSKKKPNKLIAKPDLIIEPAEGMDVDDRINHSINHTIDDSLGPSSMTLVEMPTGSQLVRVLSSSTRVFSLPSTTFLQLLDEPCIVNTINATPTPFCPPMGSKSAPLIASPSTFYGLQSDFHAPVAFNIVFDPRDKLFPHCEVDIKFSSDSSNLVFFTPSTGTWPVTFLRPEAVQASLLFSIIRSIVAGAPDDPYHVTLVGVELWAHNWLGSALEDPKLLDPTFRGEPLEEPTPIDMDMEERLWYWIDQIARASGLYEDEIEQLLSAVEILSMEEFRAHIGCDEEVDMLLEW
jgi:hypothetical protein